MSIKINRQKIAVENAEIVVLIAREGKAVVLILSQGVQMFRKQSS